MTTLIASWGAIFLTVPLLGALRLLCTGSDVSWGTIALHLSYQAAITGIIIWVTALLGPLTPQTLLLTAAGLFLETGYRFYRKWMNG